MSSSLQVTLRVPRQPLEVAGIPAVIRAARSLAEDPNIARVAFENAPETLLASWGHVLSQIQKDAPEPSPALATVEVSSAGIPEGSALVRFGADAAASGHSPVSWVWAGETVAVYRAAEGGETEGTVAEAAWPGPTASSIPASASSWTPVRSAGEARAAESRLFASLGKPTDGFLSRFDRRISTFLSRRLIRTSVTPNQITWASIVVGLAGACAVASRDVPVCVAGSLLVWLSAILDGCDGEVARIKLQSSEKGARLDLFGDHVVNFAVLAAVAVHVQRLHPPGFTAAAILLGLGVLASAWTVARLSTAGGEKAGVVDLAVERLASRDFVYLLIPLAAIGRLDWFFWGAAAGSNLFWMSLWVIHGRRRSGRREDDEIVPGDPETKPPPEAKPARGAS